MKMSEKSFRYLAPVCVALAAGTLAALCAQSVAGAPIGPIVLAAIASMAAGLATVFLHRARDGGAARFSVRVGKDIDRIMIGAAETSFFVDTVKKKIEQDVHAASEIAANAEQISNSTEKIAANAERASRVAAIVRSESVAGRAQVDRGIEQINNARQDAQTASNVMAALQDKSRRIHVITEVINEIAARTNLLALNATIEAARAGEH